MQPEDAWWCYKNISKHNKADNKLNKTKLININFFSYIEGIGVHIHSTFTKFFAA